MRHIISDPRGNPVYTSFGSWRSRNRENGFSSTSYAAHHNPRSIMFLHVRASNWNSVILRAKSHPREVIMFDDNGNTPLHVACKLDPPIEVLVALNDAVAQTNSWGATPLHIAASHRCNVHTLKKLIDYFPGALCRLSKMHRTPIHYACMSYRGLDLVAFQVLLEETIQESRRLQECYRRNEQLRRHHISQDADCDSKITDFIDILRDAKDDIKDDDILNDEEISVLLDNDSGHVVAGFSSEPPSFVNERLTSDKMEDDNDSTFLSDSEKHNNAVTWKDTSGKTPLGLLFRRYRERVKRVIQILEQMKNSSSNFPPSSASLQTDLGHLWGKARLIVVLLANEYRQKQYEEMNHSIGNISETERQDDDSSASGQHWNMAASWSKELSSRHVDGVSKTIDVDKKFDEANVIHPEEKQFRIVHASVGLAGFGCPPEMVRLAMSIYPQQVREMDENGNLPLHIAATASSLGSLTSNNSVADEESSVFSDSIVSLFSGVSSKKYRDSNGNFDSFDKVIKLLLKQYPEAAQTPHGRSGRLPLVLADRGGNRSWNDGMKTLLRAYPPALFSGSKGVIPVKLYPHVLSLIGGGDPQDFSRKSIAGVSKFSAIKTIPSCRRSDNRLSGRGGIGLLHNLMLLKQRHMNELMGGTPGSFNMYQSSSVIERERGDHINASLSNREGISQNNGSPSFSTDCESMKPERKKRKELVTTMYELLRAKPDLIEACRSHRANLKSESGKSGRNQSGQQVKFASDSGSCRFSENGDSYEQKQSAGRRTKKTSRLFKERMKVFEGQTWKPT